MSKMSRPPPYAAMGSAPQDGQGPGFENVGLVDEPVITAEIDTTQAGKSLCMRWSCIPPFCLCFPCIWCCASSYAKSQQLYITDRYVRVKWKTPCCGFAEDRWVPLEAINEVTVASGCCECGTNSVRIETPGSMRIIQTDNGKRVVGPRPTWGLADPNGFREQVFRAKEAAERRFGHNMG